MSGWDPYHPYRVLSLGESRRPLHLILWPADDAWSVEPSRRGRNDILRRLGQVERDLERRLVLLREIRGGIVSGWFRAIFPTDTAVSLAKRLVRRYERFGSGPYPILEKVVVDKTVRRGRKFLKAEWGPHRRAEARAKVRSV